MIRVSAAVRGIMSHYVRKWVVGITCAGRSAVDMKAEYFLTAWHISFRKACYLSKNQCSVLRLVKAHKSAYIRVRAASIHHRYCLGLTLQKSYYGKL